jgi:hypothetical protein
MRIITVVQSGTAHGIQNQKKETNNLLEAQISKIIKRECADTAILRNTNNYKTQRRVLSMSMMNIETVIVVGGLNIHMPT